MLQETRLRVVDNSGGKTAKVISNKLVRVVVVYPSKKVKKGQLYEACIVTRKKEFTRLTGITVKGYTNDVLLLKSGALVGTRIYRPLPIELKFRGLSKLLTIANSVY